MSPKDRACIEAWKGLLAYAGTDCAWATVYTLATLDTAVVGEDQTVETVYEATLYDLAAKFSLGSEEIIRANTRVAA